MVEVNWTIQSLNDIDSISEFIAKDSMHYAQIQAKRFFDAVLILEKVPQYGKIVPEKKDPLLREILLGSYRIIYRIVSDEKIDIVTIHHSKRLLKNNPALGE